MGKMLRLRQSKIFISFLIALVLVFSYEQSKPKAIAPLIGFGASVLAGMIAEEAATMGFKWFSKSAGKKKADEWAAEMWNKADSEPFDFAKTNPYLNKDGSVYVSPSAADRARIASFLAGAGVGLITEDMLNKKTDPLNPGGAYYAQNGDTTYTMAKGGVPDWYWDYVGSVLSPTLEEGTGYTDQYFYYLKSDLTGLPYTDNTARIGKGETYESRLKTLVEYNACPQFEAYYLRVTDGQWVKFSATQNVIGCDAVMVKSFEQYQSANDFGAGVHTQDGIMIPTTVYNVTNYNYQDYVDGVYLDNFPDLEGKRYLFPNLMPPGDVEGQITWGDIENNYPDVDSIDAVIDANDDAFYESGDGNLTVYDDATINNVYVGGEPVDKPPATIPDGEVVPIDRSLLVIAKESYQYLADTVKSSIDGLTAVTAGATGLITFLGDTMGWLPEEWRVMYAAAFGLGLFAFFFRR